MYSVDNNGVIKSQTGIPCSPRIFADGRTNFSLSEEGIENVAYFIKTGKSRSSWVFVKRLFDGLRWFVEKNNKTYKLQYENSSIYPYGIFSNSTLNIDDQKYYFSHDIYTVNNSIIIQIKCSSNFDGYVKIELHDTFGIHLTDRNDCRYYCGDGFKREWMDWTFDGKSAICGGYKDVFDNGKKSDCCIRLTSNTNSTYIRKNNKNIMKVCIKDNNNAAFALTFRPADEEYDYNKFIANIDCYKQKQEKRYKEIQEHMPVLKSKYKKLNDFVALAPIYHESMKTIDRKGAVRANNNIYWTWGWDGITATECYGYWNDLQFACDMLEYYYETKHEKYGIAHGILYDDTFGGIMAAPAQGLFITLLYYCYSMTEDKSYLEKYYEFCKWIINYFEANLDKKTGFMKGVSLIPDFPEFIKETGNDLSTFNNMIAYCALRSMEKIANILDDNEMIKRVSNIYKSIEENFEKMFFDEDSNFFVTSIDSINYEQRKVHILSSLKFENLFLEDLVHSTKSKTVKFIEKNLIGQYGLRDMPLDSDSYDRDGNQLHCWWPVHSEYFINIANAENKGNMIDKFISYIEYWTNKLMCPEGISYYIENEAEEDRWNCTSGIFQAYSLRGWYQAVIHGVIGVKFDGFGISILPYDSDDVCLERVTYKNKIINLYKKGRGKYLSHITVNGQEIRGTNRISDSLLGEVNNIEIICTNTKYQNGHILMGQDLDIKVIDIGKKFEIKGNATNTLYIKGKGNEKIYINGIEAEYLFANEEICLTIFIEKDKAYTVEIV